jgi:hypothetical protein
MLSGKSSAINNRTASSAGVLAVRGWRYFHDAAGVRFLRLMPRGSCPGLNRTVMRLTSAGRGWQHPPMSAARLAGGRQPTAQVMCLDVKADRGSTAIRREGCSWVTKATAAPYRPNFAPATLIGQGRLCSGLTTRPNIGYEQSQQLDS